MNAAVFLGHQFSSALTKGWGAVYVRTRAYGVVRSRVPQSGKCCAFKGKEAGLKFDLFNRKLTGSIGWFELTNGNILVTDKDRNAADPRHVRTEVDPNPATADPGRRLQVSWNRAIEGNTTEGIETDLVWVPPREFTFTTRVQF